MRILSNENFYSENVKKSICLHSVVGELISLSISTVASSRMMLDSVFRDSKTRGMLSIIEFNVSI